MMLPWRSTRHRYWLGLLYVSMLLTESVVRCNIIQTVLGLPTECLHHNKVRPCRLSFSCWLQGGQHAQGCGDNRWLFSCCITDKDAAAAAAAAAAAPTTPAMRAPSTSASAATAAAAAGHQNNAVAASAPVPTTVIYVAGQTPPHVAIKGHVVRKPPVSAKHSRPTVRQKPAAPPAGGHSSRPPPPKPGKYHPSKKNVLRRRTDDGAVHTGGPAAQPPALGLVECGIARSAQNTLQKRIIGGRTARFAEYPWQAHIRIAEFQCGGVLVARQFIATAAHCIQQARVKDIVVYLGELDTQSTVAAAEPLPAEKHRVIKKLVHPRFQFRVTQPDRYDLALLQLAAPASYKNHILPICLPTARLEIVGRKGVIAGWGKTHANMGHTGTNVLQSAAVPIISTDDCVKWHESKQISVELFDEMFCAGHSDGHQDACLGDSGGPLIVRDARGRYTLVGITSAGFGCGIDHQPGIYHNVQLTTRWIQDVIQKALL